MSFWDGLMKGMKDVEARGERADAKAERQESRDYARSRDALSDERYTEAQALAERVRAQANSRYETGVATDNSRYEAQQERIDRQDALKFAETNANLQLAITAAGGTAPSTDSPTDGTVTTSKAPAPTGITPGGPPSNSLGRAPAPENSGPDVPSEGSAIYSDDMTADAATLAGLVGSMDDMDEADQSYWSTITSSSAASSEALNWFEKQNSAGNTVDIKDLPMYLKIVGTTPEVGREALEDVRRRLSLVGEGDIKYPELLQESLVAIGKFRAGEVLTAVVGAPSATLTSTEADRGFGDVLMSEAESLRTSLPEGSPEQKAVLDAIGLINGGKPGAVARGRGELVRMGVGRSYIEKHMGNSDLLSSYFRQIPQAVVPEVNPVLASEPSLGSTSYDPVPSLNRALEQGATTEEMNQLKAELIDSIAYSDSLTGDQKAEQADLVRGYQSVNQAPPGTGTERPLSREEEVSNMREEGSNIVSTITEGVGSGLDMADRGLGYGVGALGSVVSSVTKVVAAVSDYMGLDKSISEALYNEILDNNSSTERMQKEGLLDTVFQRAQEGIGTKEEFFEQAYSTIYNMMDKKNVGLPTYQEIMVDGSLMHKALDFLYTSLGAREPMDNPVGRGSFAPSSGSTASVNTGRTGLGGTPSGNNLSPREPFESSPEPRAMPSRNPHDMREPRTIREETDLGELRELFNYGRKVPLDGMEVSGLSTSSTASQDPTAMATQSPHTSKVDPQSEAMVTEALTSILQSPETSEAEKDQAMEEFMDLFGFSKTRQVVQSALGIERVPTNR